MSSKGGLKKNVIFRGHVRKGRGSTPIPLKIVDFFQTKCKKYSACPEYFLTFSGHPVFVVRTTVEIKGKNIKCFF